jgi:hypothetical protein
MKLIAKVVLAFLIWMFLVYAWDNLTPVAYREYRMSIGVTDSNDVPRLTERYQHLVTNIVAMGFHPEPELRVSGHRETRFTGNYGNIYSATVDVTLDSRRQTSGMLLRLSATYKHPRWKDGGSADHLALREAFRDLITESRTRASTRTARPRRARRR